MKTYIAAFVFGLITAAAVNAAHADGAIRNVGGNICNDTTCCGPNPDSSCWTRQVQ